MIGENLRARRALAAFMIAMGLVALVALAVLLSRIGGDLDQMWTSRNDSLRGSAQTLRQSSDAVDRASNILSEVDQSGNATTGGLDSLIDGLAAARETNSAVGEGLVSTGGFLLVAGDSLPRWPAFEPTRNAINGAGLKTAKAGARFDALGSNWIELEARVREVRGSLVNLQSDLPAAREDLNGVSRGLTHTASSLASIEETSGGLRQSGLLFWAVVVLLGCLGALALAMIAGGVLLL